MERSQTAIAHASLEVAVAKGRRSSVMRRYVEWIVWGTWIAVAALLLAAVVAGGRYSLLAHSAYAKLDSALSLSDGDVRELRADVQQLLPSLHAAPGPIFLVDVANHQGFLQQFDGKYNVSLTARREQTGAEIVNVNLASGLIRGGFLIRGGGVESHGYLPRGIMVGVDPGCVQPLGSNVWRYLGYR
jgi:hypothetical protein